MPLFLLHRALVRGLKKELVSVATQRDADRMPLFLLHRALVRGLKKELVSVATQRDADRGLGHEE